MSLSFLLLSLSIISGVFFVYMSAKQFVRPDKITWIQRQAVPVWIWICGIFVSSILTTLEVLRYVNILYIFPAEFTIFIYVVILFVLTIYALVVILMQFSPPLPALNSREKLMRSVLSGCAASIGLSSALSILWILLDSNSTSNVGGLICLLIPAQLIATIGTYSKLGWQKKIEDKARAFYESHIPKDGDGSS